MATLSLCKPCTCTWHQVGIEIEIPENSVQKVGDFKALALRAEQDGHLRQRLQHVLKLRYVARWQGQGGWGLGCGRACR